MSDDIDKLRFELEMRRVFSDIEQLRKAIEASQSTKSDEINKIREALDKIKGDMEKLQKSPSEKDQDALKKELESIKAELEKLKKAPSDKDNSDKKDDPAMKSELEQLRKILENIQDSKLRDSLDQTKKAVEASQNKIVEAIEKLKEAVEKKPAAPSGPSGPSPDIQALKESLEQIKKTMEASQSSKMMEALEKIREAVEKKPPPPPPPAENPLKNELELIRRAIEDSQKETQRTLTAFTWIIGILIFILIGLLTFMTIATSRDMTEIKEELLMKKGGKKSSQNESDSKSKPASSDVRSVKVNESLHIINGQAVVRLEKLTDKSVTIELTLPNMKVYKMEDMKVGNRMRFEYDSETYFLDLVKISKDSAKLKVYKRTSA